MTAAPRLVAYVTAYVASIYCPGCERDHRFCIGPQDDGQGRVVGYNGLVSAGPTFDAIFSTRNEPQRGEVPLCGFKIVKGVITFAVNCEHALAGQTMPLPPFPDDFWPGGTVPTCTISRNKLK